MNIFAVVYRYMKSHSGFIYYQVPPIHKDLAMYLFTTEKCVKDGGRDRV